MQVNRRILYTPALATGGGGSAFVVTPLGANATDGAFAGVSPWVAGSGVTLGTGDVYLFVFCSTANVTAPTIGGVTATLVGTTTDSKGTCWKATGVNTASGNISIPIASGAYNNFSANWFLVSGAGATNTFTSTDYAANAPASPSISGFTIPSGGAALVSLLDNGQGSTRQPTTWTNCDTPGNTTLEFHIVGGNGTDTAGNFSTTPGSPTITATGTATYLSSNGNFMVVTVRP